MHIKKIYTGPNRCLINRSMSHIREVQALESDGKYFDHPRWQPIAH